MVDIVEYGNGFNLDEPMQLLFAIRLEANATRDAIARATSTATATSRSRPTATTEATAKATTIRLALCSDHDDGVGIY
jgi:hypothetical protein